MQNPRSQKRRVEKRQARNLADSMSFQAKRRKVDMAYDLEDPFIDDSELTIDAPTHFGRAKKEGFFVHQGVLELAQE